MLAAMRPRRLGIMVAAVSVAAFVARPAAADAAGELEALLATTPAESLVAPLRHFEASRSRAAEGAEAALVLGHLHFARGEYREAASAFARAAARLDPARKPEARYWVGLAWLGLGEPAQARAALEEVARTSTARRLDAILGNAQAWEIAQRPERAFDALVPLLQEKLGETGPAVLERGGALAERLNHAEPARRARERLLSEYPRSIEAASARLTLAASAQRPGPGGVAIVIGTFADQARARALASEARRAGFPQAQVITRGEGLAALHVVRLGIYSSGHEARAAADQATRALGVACAIVRAP